MEHHLPSGYTLTIKDNEVGGRSYYSDEVGNGILVWDTALVDKKTLLAAIKLEERLNDRRATNKQTPSTDQTQT